MSEPSYRDQALKIYPWICGRCAREFTLSNLRELTVHPSGPQPLQQSARWQQLGAPLPLLPRQRAPEALELGRAARLGGCSLSGWPSSSSTETSRWFAHDTTYCWA